MKISTFFKKTHIWLANLTVGGSWGRTLTARIQRNLRWFWFDGLFASASDNIIVNFVSIYILALGASETQIGLMNSITNIASAVVLMPGAFLAERLAYKKPFSLVCGILARSSIFMLVFVPIFFKGSALIWIAITFSVLRDVFNNMGYPAWMSIVNQIVPIEGRGRFFGSRNFIMNITGMIATLAAGKLISLFVTNLGYQIALGLAFVLGMSSSFSFSHIHEQPDELAHPTSGIPAVSLPKIIKMLKSQPQFAALALTTAIWNFGINVSGPFFNVHMVKDLKFSAAVIGFVAVITSITTLLTQNQIGSLSDRIGSYRLQLFAMLLIPLLPLAWIPSTQVWHIVVINAFSGIVWGIYNLVSFNLLLVFIPADQIPRYSAIYQIIVLLSLALGALVGSILVSYWGFVCVCIVSAVIRYIAAAYFARFVRDPQKGPSPAA
jgi:MFS family permease